MKHNAQYPYGIMTPRRAGFLFAPLISLSILTGCATPKAPSLADVESKHLGFLELGNTTREDILVRLGTPSSVFENERILTYRLRLGPKGTFVNSPFAHYPYGLTVVFDRDGRLSKYKLRQQ